MMKLLVLYAVLIAITAISAGAASFLGPTGLVVMPTAESLDQWQIQVFANHVGRDDCEANPIGGNMGLGHGIEVGITQSSETGINSDNELILNAKWTALQETGETPAVAVGGINLMPNDDFRGTYITRPGESEPNLYLVLSKKLSADERPVAVHAGYIGGSIRAAMLGISAQASPGLDLMADWVDGFTELSFGARYRATDDLGIDVSLIDGDLAIGTAYAFTLK